MDQLMLMEQLCGEALGFSGSVPAFSHHLLWGISGKQQAVMLIQEFVLLCIHVTVYISVSIGK